MRARQGAPTPLEIAPEALSGGRHLYLKREDVHQLGAFKWRGALPALTEYRARGHDTVVTASTGNHGAAAAWAADRLRLRAVVRAIAREILGQLTAPPAAVVVPVGNGALLGGIGAEILERSPVTARVGVQSAGAPVMVESWRAGAVVECASAETFADGLAARVAVPLAVDVLRRVASRMLLVSERAIARAVGAFAAAGIRVEGSAAAGLAALDQLEDADGSIVIVVTGRNIDDELWRRACDEPESFPGES